MNQPTQLKCHEPRVSRKGIAPMRPILAGLATFLLVACSTTHAFTPPPPAQGSDYANNLTAGPNSDGSWVVDIGTVGDGTLGADGIFIDTNESTGLSERLSSGGVDYRELAADGETFILVDPSGMTLSATSNGVPYTHACVEIWHGDDAYSAGRLGIKLDCGPYCNMYGGYWDLGNFGTNGAAWSKSTILIESTPWQTLRTTSVDETQYFQFRIQNNSSISLRLDSVALRFLTGTEFEQARQAERDARGYRQREYLETNSEAGLPEADFVLYSRNYLEKIYPNTIPSLAEINDIASNGLSLSELAGESEPVSFGIYASTNGLGLENVNVQATDLVSPLGGSYSIPAADLDIALVQCIDKNWHWQDWVYGKNPWYLLPFETFDLQPGRSRQIWITVTVPQDTPPGQYAGYLNLTADEQDSVAIPITVHVSSVTLDLPDATPYLYWAPDAPGSNMLWKGLQEAAWDDMAAHGMSPFFRAWPSFSINTALFDPSNPSAEHFNVSFKHSEESLQKMVDEGIQIGDSQGRLLVQMVAIVNSTCESLPIPTIWEKIVTAIDPDDDSCFLDNSNNENMEAFDAYFTLVLEAYADFLRDDFGVTPVFIFVDEPMMRIDRRRVAHHLNDLAHQAGFETFTLYIPECDIRLNGHRFMYTASNACPSESCWDQPQDLPDWLINDSALGAYWDFSDPSTISVPDISGHGNDGTLANGAVATGGVLRMTAIDQKMDVLHSNDLDLSTNGTVSLWFKPNEFADSYRRVFKKDLNYGFYFCRPTEHPVSWAATAGGTWTNVSGYQYISSNGLEEWHQVLWTYDSETGGTMVVDGTVTQGAGTGILTTNTNGLQVGQFVGDMDNVALLKRTLSPHEMAELALGDSISASITAQNLTAEQIGTNGISFYLYDDDNHYDKKDESGETGPDTTKQLWINKTLVWEQDESWDPETDESCEAMGDRLHCEYTIPYAVCHDAFYTTGDSNTVGFRVIQSGPQDEDLRVYFLDENLRNADWEADTNGIWTYEYSDDPDLAPLDDSLDHRMYNLARLNSEEIGRTNESGDELGYYTTRRASQPVIVNNRFLNGIYASALGVSEIGTYAYADYVSANPYDELTPKRSTSEENVRDVGYCLVEPSWEKVVYPTLPYESLREGIEDSRITARLLGIIQDVDDQTRSDWEIVSGTAGDAAAFLDDVFQRPSRDYNSQYDVSRNDDEVINGDYPYNAFVATYADRSLDMIGDLCTNGVESICSDAADFSVFDNIRDRMISYILAMTDSDGDTVYDNVDNCPLLANTNGLDCDSNGMGDVCEIAYGFQADCNSNGIPDNCETDCNTNGIPDDCEIAADGDLDRDDNGILDECEPPILSSAFSRKLLGYRDIPSYSSAPNNAHAVECRQGGITYAFFVFNKRPYSLEGTTTFVPSDVEVSSGTVSSVWAQAYSSIWIFKVALTGATDAEPWTCSFSIQDEDGRQGYYSDCWGVLLGDVDRDGELTTSDYDLLVAHDGVPISVTNFYYDLDLDGEIETGTGEDDLLLFQANLGSGPLDPGCGPDDCETAITPGPDCNTNGYLDECDIRRGTSWDCNTNGIPDSCELAAASSTDCNTNGVLDECDIASGTSLDLNTNGLPDECEPAPPVMTDALSRKAHGSPTAIYSIAAGNTESRYGGITQVKFLFDRVAYSTDGDDFVAGDFILSRGTITNVTTAWDDMVRPTVAEITLDISGVTTLGQLTVSFSAENSVGLGQSYEACWTYIPADVDNDGDVDDDDETVIIAADQGRLGTYFRCDLDLDGTIEGDDKDGDDWTIWSGVVPVSPQTLCGD